MDSDRNAELTRGFVQAMRRRNLAEATTINRRHTLLVALGAAHDLQTLTGEELERWVQKRRMIARSRNAFLADMRSFYEWAMRAGEVAANPVDTLQRSKVPRLLPRPIDEDDLARALQLAKPRMRTWLVLAAYGGLRCKEIASLAAEDLVWHKRPPMIFVKAGKGGHQRVIVMAEIVEEAVREDDLPHHGFLFRSQVGHEHVSANSVSHLIGRYLRELDIHATAHMLRHHFGTRCYETTGDIRITQEMLGHVSPTTTAIYAAWSPAKAAEALRTLGPRAS